MKKILYILTLLISQTFWAQDVFDKGNEYYREGDYEKAIEAYESILNDKKHSAELYFNLANAYYKMDKVALSIYYYEKALLLNPNNKDIKNNLKFAQNKTIDEIKEVPDVRFEKVLQNFTGILTYNAWAKISVGLAFLFFLLFLGYYFSDTTRAKRIFFVGMFIIPILIIISILSAWFEKELYKTDRPAIVFAEIVPVKNEPRENASESFVLHEGTKVFVLESLDNWRKIQLSDDTEGWLRAENIKELR
ncbi:MAG: tetratricopeptide repeat protein [Candidatus Kapabacteria bacterium]|jgi:tetratricopeptide (TPR) repeat protein|nr:tetratricopeptide repeat protein [Candidatus Kapabacteria bacterium]